MDLFEPGSGSQVHDVNGGVLPSGLFWTVDLAEATFRLSDDGRRVRLRVRNLAGIDTFVIFGSSSTPATLTYEVELRALGGRVTRGKGNTVPPTDPAAFVGRFFDAAGVGRYSGQEVGLAFETDEFVTTAGTFAEFGQERNGVFL